MADLAQLLVRIDATTEQLRRELARADAAVTTSQRNIDAKLGLIDARFSKASTAVTAFAGGVMRGLVPALGAITAIRAGQALGEFTVGLVTAGDEIAETARSLDLSTDALQEYRGAVSLAGVTTDEFERAIKFMNNAVGTFARTGKGEAADALAELGLAAEISSGQLQGADAIFLALIDRLGQVEDAQKRASLVADVFGQRIGPKMASLIAAGAPALEQTRQQVRDLGAVMSPDAIARAGRLADAWDLLAVAAKGLGVTIGQYALPALERLTSALSDLAGSRPDEALLDQIEELTSAQNVLAQALQQTPPESPVFKNMQAEMAALDAQIIELQKKLDTLRQGRVQPAITFPEIPEDGGGGGGGGGGGTPRAPQAALLDAEIQKMERQAVLLREHQLTSEQISAILSQEFQTAESGVEVFNAMAQANRERLAGAIANLDAAKNEAAFLDRLRQAQGQNVSATLGFDSAELRDAAEAAQELGFNIQNISTPAEFQAWLDGLPQQTQDAIEKFQSIQTAASDIQIGQQLDAQLAELELANSAVNQQTESYRVQAQILQLELQTQRQITDAQRDKVAAIQQQITLQRQNQALQQLERETAATQQRIGAAGDPRAQLMSRLTGGLAPQEQRVQGRLDEAALQGIDPATIEASARQMEELNTQMAIAETVSGELAQGATELGAALAFEGVDEAGARLTEMLQSLVQGLTEAILQALIFRAIMAGISGFGVPTTATPAPGQTGPGGMLGHAQKGGHFDKGRRVAVAEDRKTELWVPDALTPPHLTPRDVPAIATATELPEIAVRRLSSSRPGRVLLGIVSGGGEPLAAPTEIGEGGDPRNVAAPAGVALLGAEGRPEIILATTPGTVLPNPDVVALQSSPAGRSFLRQIEQRQLGGPIQAGKPYQVGEAGRELVIGGDAHAKIVGATGREIIVPQRDSTVISHGETERILTQIATPAALPEPSQLDGLPSAGETSATAPAAQSAISVTMPGLQAGGWATAMPPVTKLLLSQIEQRQLGGPIQAGKPYQVGEAGRELLLEDGKARLIGVSGREVIVPKTNSIVFPHGDTERLMAAVPALRSAGTVMAETPAAMQQGREIVVPEAKGPAFPRTDDDRLIQMLPGLQAGGWATAMPPVTRPPAAPAASGAPNVSFQVIDQRGKDAPPIETTTQTMPDGRVMAVAIVRAARAEMARTGEDQEYMRRQFGIGPRPR